MVKKIAVIGARGFVGSHLIRAIDKLGHISISIYRGDDYQEKISSADLIIHAANSASRFKASQNIEYDFQESVEKTFNFASPAKQLRKKFILISSISARTQLSHPYGINRRSAECIVQMMGGQVIRLGYMYSQEKVYGALNDIFLNKDVYLSGESRYSYSDISWNAEKIIKLSMDDENKMYELGANGSISLNEIVSLLNSTCRFVGEYKDIQIANDHFPDSPNIEKFKTYLETLK